MATLLELIRSLGSAGAAENARQLLEERRREELVVQRMVRRLAPSGDTSPLVA